MYYANEGSVDGIDPPTKMIKYWIRNISRNIGAVIFKLGTSDVHHKRNKMTPTILFPWQNPWIQSLSMKNQISPFATFLSGTGGLPRNRHDDHIVLTLPIRLLGVDDSCVRWNLEILVVIKTRSAAWLLSWQRHDSCHFVSFVMYISGAKFEDHYVNISGDILNSVFYRFSGTIYDVTISLICIIQKRKYLLNEKRYSKKENTVLYFERPFKWSFFTS